MIQDGHEHIFQHLAEADQERNATDNRELVEAMFERALQQANGCVPRDAKGVHHTELPAKQPGEPLADEWNTYRREIGRLLAEGQAGRHVLIKGQDIIAIVDTSSLAYAEGYKRFAGQEFFVHPIRAEEPYQRIRGINFPWPSLRSR